MPRTIRVVFNKQPIEAPINVSIAELLVDHPHPGEVPAIGAIVDNQLSGLGRRLRGDTAVDTVDQTSKAGAEIFRRTAVLLLTRAVETLYPECHVIVGQSIANGYFFDLRGRPNTAELAQAIEAEMLRISDADAPIRFSIMPVDEVIRYYDERGLHSKANILRISRFSEVLTAQLEGRLTYPYGPLATHAGVVRNFTVIPYEDGLVLRFPDRRGRTVRRLAPQPRLFGAFRESSRWNELIGVSNLSELNRALIEGRAGQLIRLAEGLHEKKIVQVADMIAARRSTTRLVTISGPSSSGKTTFSKRLDIQLRVNGIEPVTLSLDNYYLPPEESPTHPDGTRDFEHLEALDLPLLREQLPRLIAGEKVDTPLFDFAIHRRRTDKALTVQLRPDQVLVIEGIHALNPRLTETIAPEAKFKIFVSALTQLMIDEHNRIFTSDGRLIRRIVRDRLFRNYSAQSTIEMWDSVRLGEQRWIFPFQEDCDGLFNSAHIYEHALLKTYAVRFLMETPRESPAFVEADRLLSFLDLFIPILPEEVPGTSVLREFIGGSVFSY